MFAAGDSLRDHLAISADNACVLLAWDCGGRLEVMDMTDPTAPQRLGAHELAIGDWPKVVQPEAIAAVDDNATTSCGFPGSLASGARLTTAYNHRSMRDPG